MRHLLTWSDRGEPRRQGAPRHERPARDEGPVLRLLREGERYAAATVVTTEAGERRAQGLVAEMESLVEEVKLVTVDVPDPSDHARVFEVLAPLARELSGRDSLDVLLSAGTPQVQTIFVVLVKAGLLPARMLQVLPPALVPDPHPEAVREVVLDVEGFPEIRALREELVRLRAEVRSLGGGLVGDSAPMATLARRLTRVAPSDLPVLVLGETGTGKELVARAIHERSARAAGPFVAESCGALDAGVLASELFGHEKGAFTGALSRRRGLFELAHGGTLLLDEVGELPPRVQVSLLRVLQEGVIRRVGGEDAVPVDVRVIAATHRDLEAMVAEGTFRQDLYYRLNAATLVVPPLRERVGDLEQLVSHFAQSSGDAPLVLTPAAWAALRSHAWPGNVRELQAEVARWGIFGDEVVDVDDLSTGIRTGAPVLAPESSGAPAEVAALRPLRDQVAELETLAIERALAAEAGNISRAARVLGIDRNTLKRKRRK
ncbi:MAG: sigma-54 dependent transcriptional regulator [Acidobacteriota bacterium]